ncbi:DUF58 domain-containing protein [Coraliomargarita algicola]|uniref:DUF58 domain-containing protein n=1 Tax=Coraliomargarita algicola TaxID=3092156 RepID=A0ABZ0RHU5_9BACT|nr:DUF58 domain-containing protein [Coraliomargarita sp. J2-16]WPJ94673.1 DUF58 domain-containing protein [Coraliomargarita sp. J2-16]
MADSQIELRRWHDWTDPDFFMEGRQQERRILPLFLRQILPRPVQRTKLTFTGWMLIIVALGIGSAAYNTSSNILFMTLSLLLSSLVLSGILAQVNFRKLQWSLQAPEHLQVGEVGMAEVVLKNGKQIFPSMSVVFRVSSTVAPAGESLYLKHSIAAGNSTSLEWTFVPKQRGAFLVQLHGVESYFPFGFLRKGVGDLVEETIWVWPTRVDYSFHPVVDGRRYQAGISRRLAGAGSDLLKVRPYEAGDPPRLIHWKATARMNQLMVRQLAQEGQSGFYLRIDRLGRDWNEAQVETLCSVACALAEDLFHAGRLETVSVEDESIAVRGMREVHAFFDLLARLHLKPGASSVNSEMGTVGRNWITFRPCGESGVTIHVNGEQAGEA